jgi:hypothetical protein
MKDLSPEGRDLFGTARREALPTAVDRTRVREAVLVRLAAPLPAPQLSSSAPTQLAKLKLVSALKILGTASAIVLAVAGARSVIGRRESAAHQSAVAFVPATHLVANGALSNPQSVSGPSPKLVSGSGESRDDSSAAAATVDPSDKPRAAHVGALPSASSARDDMAPDLALLSSARQALAAHQPAEALQELDRHAKQYPASAFREERAYTRIRALCELGRTAQARADAAHFARAWPSSMYRSGIERSCAGNTEQ